MKHLVWGILVILYLVLLVAFPTPMTYVSLFLGAYKVSEISTIIGKWVDMKYKAKNNG